MENEGNFKTKAEEAEEINHFKRHYRSLVTEINLKLIE